MTNVIITDTHFGAKQNSITWFNSQSDFIYKQLIPSIKRISGGVRLIHMGDVFDSRASISVYIAKKVRKIFEDLAEVCEEVIIIAGNHDFYSPNTDEYDSLSLTLENIDRVRLVIKDCYQTDEYLFVPWYKWDGLEIPNNVKYVFAHTDIVGQDPNIRKGVKVFSGHIHYPFFKGNRYNLGSCYSLDFSDSNKQRGFYILQDDKLEFIPNEHSIRFWRLKNDEIFEVGDFNEFDYLELYINQINLSLPAYVEKINDYTKIYKNVWVIPMSESSLQEDIKFEGYDIEGIIKENLPEELKEKFDKIKQRLNECI